MQDSKIHYQKFGANCFQLVENFHFETEIKTGFPCSLAFIEYDGNGQVELIAGFAWDGASDGNLHQTKAELWFSIHHDPVFRLMRAGLIPTDPWFKVANYEMEKHAREVGIPHLVADIIALAVQEFGRGNTIGGNPIMEAP